MLQKLKTYVYILNNDNYEQLPNKYSSKTPPQLPIAASRSAVHSVVYLAVSRAYLTHKMSLAEGASDTEHRPDADSKKKGEKPRGSVCKVLYFFF